MGYRDLITSVITEILTSFDDSVSIKIIEDQNGQEIGYEIFDSHDEKGVIYTFTYTMERLGKEPVAFDFILEFKVWGEVIVKKWNRESHRYSSKLAEKFKALYPSARKKLDQELREISKENNAFNRSYKKLIQAVDFVAKPKDFNDYAFKINDFLCSRFIDFPTHDYNEMVKDLSASDPEIYKELIEHLDYMDSLSDQLMSECEARIDFKDKQSEKVA